MKVQSSEKTRGITQYVFPFPDLAALYFGHIFPTFSHC